MTKTRKLFSIIALAMMMILSASSALATNVYHPPQAPVLVCEGVLWGEYLRDGATFTHDVIVEGLNGRQTVLDTATESPGDYWSIRVGPGPLNLSILNHDDWVERFLGGAGADHFLFDLSPGTAGAWSAVLNYEDMNIFIQPRSRPRQRTEGHEPDFNDVGMRIWFDPDCRDCTSSPVPEPGTYAMIGLGLAGLAFRRRNNSPLIR